MKKILVFVMFLMVLAVSLMYYEDPRYYQRQFRKQSKKYRKQFDCWQHCLHEMMPF